MRRPLLSFAVAAPLVLAAGLVVGVLAFRSAGEGSTAGACELRPADLGLDDEPRSIGSEPPCDRVEVSTRSVVATGGVAAIDWSEAIKVCEKHPSAAEVSVAVRSSGATTEVVTDYFRGDVAPGQDPVEAIVITVPEGYAPRGEIQPVLVCRSSEAELVAVFRSGGS